MIGLQPSTHEVAGRRLSIGAAGWPVVPTWVRARCTWSAETTTMHPDPARLAADVWVPDDAGLALDLGNPVRCMVSGDPIRDPNGDETVGSARPYFTGRVDSITFERRELWTGREAAPVADWSVLVDDAARTSWAEDTGDGGRQWSVTGGALHQIYVEFTTPVDAPGVVLLMPPVVGATRVTVNGSEAAWSGAPGGYTFTLPDARAGDRVGVQAWIAKGDLVHTMPAPLIVRPGKWRRVAGLLVSFTAVSHLAVLGRTYIGDEPWPVETCADRAWRIANTVEDIAGLIVSPDDGETMTARLVRARDIDRRSALEVARLTAAAAGGIVSESQWAGEDVQVGQQAELSAFLWKSGQPGAAVEIADGYRVARIPASTLVDRPRVRDLATLANTVTTRYYTPDAESKPAERSTTTSDPESIIRYGPSERTYESDLWVPAGGSLDLAAPGLVDRAARIVRACREPETRLDGDATVVPAVAGQCAGLIECVTQGRRHGLPVDIEGAPDGIKPRRRVIAGALTFGAGAGLDLVLEHNDRAVAQAVLVRRAFDWKWTFNDFLASDITIADMQRVGA